MQKLHKIFCSDLHKPPVHKVIKTGSIRVEQIKALGDNFVHNNKPRKMAISVVEDPILNQPELTDNPAHALIMEQLPRSLSFQIIDALSLEDTPSCERIFFAGNRVVVFIVAALLLAALLTLALSSGL
jgi:hypothetical protein